MLANSYLGLLNEFDDTVIEAACLHFRKTPSPFPPSSGEFYTHCVDALAAQRRADDWRNDKRVPEPNRFLAPPSRKGWTYEQLADWSCVINGKGGNYVSRTNKDGNDLKIPQGYPGAGKPAVYGYLTPAEGNAIRRAMRADPRPAVRPFSEVNCD